MRTLIVGGTGMIGCHVADLLAARGHEVTIGARKRPRAESPVASYPVLIGDYAEGGFSEEELARFDAVVFAAGQDVRHLQSDDLEDVFWQKYQIEGVPHFMERAKRAGVARAVQVGSYYHAVMPELVTTDPYVRARQLADDRSRELADQSFNVSTLNPPSIVGAIPGASMATFARMLAWGRGDLPGQVPDFAPPGGTNFMSVRSLAEAIDGALVRAEPGAAYLVGDENLTFAEYFQMVWDVSGGGRQLEQLDGEHPFLPSTKLIAGYGTVLRFEPPQEVVDLLGYRRGDVRPMLKQIAAEVRRAGGTNARNQPTDAGGSDEQAAR